MMYVWDDHDEVFVVAQADSVAQARQLALRQVEDAPWEGVTHRKFADYVQQVQPNMWRGANVEAVLKVNGLTADLNIECQRHSDKVDELLQEARDARAAIRHALQFLEDQTHKGDGHLDECITSCRKALETDGK